ncbi:MAG: macro domain-containing protein [Clostridia bacterium]|nr:macro domain-containing protein [Clostridia bacterium]
MPFKIIVGDLFEQNVDAFVTPATPLSGPTSIFAKKFFHLAGYDELMTARIELGELPNGKAGVTPGFNLMVKNIIHVSVPEWFSGFCDEPIHLSCCYCNSLKKATELNLKSIAFPLLGSGTNRIPPDIAFQIAIEAITGYIRAHNLEIRAYLIVLPNILACLPPKQINIINQHSGNNVLDTTYSSPKEIFYKYIDRIKNPTAFANAIDYAPSTISRIVNKTGKGRPNKNTILSIAIGLQLSKDERHDFINSVHYPYPFDKRDQRLEELLDQYHKEYNIRKINAILAAENPDWTLMNKSKSSDLKEKTTKHRQKQYELDI